MPYKDKEKQKEYMKDYNKQYEKDNPEKVKKTKRRYRENNPQKIKEIGKCYRKNNAEKEKERHFQWNKNNREWINKYYRNRGKTDLKFNLNKKIRCLIWQSLKGNKNGRHWENLVNYTLNDLIKHLKKTIPEGYCWRDYIKGKLHLDHITPIRAFIFGTPEDEEFKQCWSLYNLRLLPAEENRLKQDKIINPILLGFLLSEVK